MTPSANPIYGATYGGLASEVSHNTWLDCKNAILERPGRRLEARQGTGPDHDSLLRSLRGQSRVEGLAEARAEMVRQILLSRGIEVSEGFPVDAAMFIGLDNAAIVAAAFACHGERDFNTRLARLRGH